MSIDLSHSVPAGTRDDARSSGRTVPGGISPSLSPGTSSDRATRDRFLLERAGLSDAEIDQILGEWS